MLDDDRAVGLDRDVAQHAEVGERQHRQLGVAAPLGDAHGASRRSPTSLARCSRCARATPAARPAARPGSVPVPAEPPAPARASAGQAGTRSVAAPAPRSARRATSARTVAGSTATPAAVAAPPRRCRNRRRPAAARPRPAPACTRRCDSGGAVAEPDHPVGGVVAVVGQLLDALGRDRRQHRVAGVGAAARTRPAARSRRPAAGPSRSAKSPFASSTSRTLRNSSASRKYASASSSGTLGRRRPGRPTRRRAGPGQQQPGLAEQVEADVGERDLLLQLRRAGDPLGQPLRRDQGVVAEHQAVRGQVGGVDPVRARWCRRRPAGRRSRCRRPSWRLAAVGRGPSAS